MEIEQNNHYDNHHGQDDHYGHHHDHDHHGHHEHHHGHGHHHDHLHHGAAHFHGHDGADHAAAGHDGSDHDAMHHFAANHIAANRNAADHNAAAYDDAHFGAGEGEVSGPSTYVVCPCMGVTEADIWQAVADGARTLEDVEDITGAGTRCRHCEGEIEACMQQAIAAQK